MSLLTTASLVITPNAGKEGTLFSVVPNTSLGDMSVVRATTATRVNSAGLVELVPYNLLSYSQDFSNAYWVGEPGNTITSNTTTAPDGTLTADTFTATAGNGMNVHNFGSFALADGTFTYSVYLKNNGTNLIEAYLFKIGIGFAARGEINFSAGTFTASIGTGSIENVGNGWFRVSLSNTYTSGSFTTGTLTTSTTGTRSTFVWGAQLVEGSLPKDYQKTETRLNIPRLDYSNGTCPSLLVEPQRTNLALYSEQFDNAYWGVSEATISANVTVAPNGTNTADKLIESNTNALHEVYSNTPFSLTSGIAYTKTIYAKSSERTQIALNFVTGGFGQGSSVIANLTTGTLGTVTNYGGVTGSTATITNVNNGWYRISITMTPVTTATFYADFSPALNGAISYQGDGTSGLFIYGAQLEAGSYSTSFIPTTSASVTRNADVISKNPSAFLGANTGSWFIDVEDYEFQIKGTNDPTTYIGDSTSNFIGFSAKVAAYNGIVITKRESGTVTIIFQNPLKSLKACFVWNGTSLKLFINGSNVYTNNSFANFAAWDTFELNNSSRPASYNCNSSVLFPTAISDAEAITLTTV